MTTKIGNVTKTRYNQLVRRGRDLVAQQTRCQFELGDNALEIEPMHVRHGGPVDPAEGVYTVAWGIQSYAEDIGIPTSTLENYRWVASRWPEDHRVEGVSFYIYKIFAGRGGEDGLDERYELLTHPPKNKRTNEYRWDTDSAAREAGWRPKTPTSDQERIDRIHDLAKDDSVASRVITDFLRRPTVAFDAMADKTARHAVNEAQFDHARLNVGRGNKQQKLAKRVEHSIEYIDLITACTQFVTNAGRIVPDLRGHDFTAEERERVHTNLAKVRATADWIETAVDTGNVGVDEALERLLRGE